MQKLILALCLTTLTPLALAKPAQVTAVVKK